MAIETFKNELQTREIAPESIEPAVLENIQKWDDITAIQPSVYFAFNYT